MHRGFERGVDGLWGPLGLPARNAISHAVPTVVSRSPANLVVGSSPTEGTSGQGVRQEFVPPPPKAAAVETPNVAASTHQTLDVVLILDAVSKAAGEHQLLLPGCEPWHLTVSAAAAGYGANDPLIGFDPAGGGVYYNEIDGTFTDVIGDSVRIEISSPNGEPFTSLKLSVSGAYDSVIQSLPESSATPFVSPKNLAHAVGHTFVQASWNWDENPGSREITVEATYANKPGGSTTIHVSVEAPTFSTYENTPNLGISSPIRSRTYLGLLASRSWAPRTATRVIHFTRPSVCPIFAMENSVSYN